MILRIEHIGIAVSDSSKAEELFSRLLGRTKYKSEFVDSEKVNTSFYRSGETKIELVSSTNDLSSIHKFISKKGEGIHHIAFETDDIVADMSRLKAEGFQLLNETPFSGADNKLVCFIHPKSCGGVLVELCQEKK